MKPSLYIKKEGWSKNVRLFFFCSFKTHLLEISRMMQVKNEI